MNSLFSRLSGLTLGPIQKPSKLPKSRRLRKFSDRFFGGLFGVAAFLGISSGGLAQPKHVPFGQDSHAFRYILDEHRLTPLTNWEELTQDPPSGILIVLGETKVLEQIPNGLENFVRQGGAVLVATDRAGVLPQARKPGPRPNIFGTSVTGKFVQIPKDSPSAYRGLEECPIIHASPLKNLWIFQELDKVATNRPSYLTIQGNQLRPLVYFPRGSRVDGKTVPNQLPALPFAAGGQKGKGRVLVLSDHSVFINDMMLQFDNDNFDFANNCIDWLMDRGPGTQNQRSHVLFFDEGQIVTDFRVPLKRILEVRAPPVEVVNKLVAALEDENLGNRAILGRNPPERLGRIVQGLVLLSSLGLVIYGFFRLVRARHGVEANVPFQV